MPLSRNSSCGPHRIARLSEVLNELPEPPRLLSSVAGELAAGQSTKYIERIAAASVAIPAATIASCDPTVCPIRSEEHTSELQSLRHLVCRLLLEKKKTNHLSA